MRLGSDLGSEEEDGAGLRSPRNQKKRKRQSDGKTDRKRAKPDSEKTKNERTSNPETSPVKKVRTLVDMFASMKNTPRIKTTSPTSGETKQELRKTPPKMKQIDIVDLTSPEQASTVSLSKKNTEVGVKESTKAQENSRNELEKSDRKRHLSYSVGNVKSERKVKALKVVLKKRNISKKSSSQSKTQNGEISTKKGQNLVKGTKNKDFLKLGCSKIGSKAEKSSMGTKKQNVLVKKNKNVAKGGAKKRDSSPDLKSHETNGVTGNTSVKSNRNKNGRKCRTLSSDGVAFVGEVKNSTPVKTTFAESKRPHSELPPLECETILWSEKYEPKSASEVLGNTTSVEKLFSWLKEWKKRWEQEKAEILGKENCAKSRSYDSDSDFELDDDDQKALKKDEDSFPKLGVVVGPAGSGKTSSIFACANELQFKIFEMNTSSQRSSKQILSRLHEATQSHQVSKAKNAFNFFKVTEKSTKKIEGDSLILLKDVEILFEEDRSFWSAIDTLVSDTKRPIILTTNDCSVLKNLERKHEKFFFCYPRIDKQLDCLKKIAEKENCDITEENYCDVRMMIRLLGCDLKKSIHALHFWGSGNLHHNAIDVESPKAVGKTSAKSRKKRRRSSRSKVSSQNKVESDTTPETKVALTNLFSKSCGMHDVISLNEMQTFNDVMSALVSSRTNEGREKIITQAEKAISIMTSSNMPSIIKLNWWSLVPGSRDFTMKKCPLKITVPQSLVSSNMDMEFQYEFGVEEPAAAFAEEPADFLIDEDSVDISFDARTTTTVPSSGTANPLGQVRKLAKKSAKSKMELDILESLSSMSDMFCISDMLERTFSKGQNSQEILKQTLDVSRCKLQDGLLDVILKEGQNTLHNVSMHGELQSSIQTRCFAYYGAKMAEVVPGYRASMDSCQEYTLRLPHEGKSLKNQQYLRHSMQIRFAGGLFSTAKNFTTDYLPAIRSISRSENLRKELKKRRRFLHYFDTIRVFPKPQESSKLLNDYKEVFLSSK